VIKLIKEGGHHIGLHAENTRSFESFKEEIKALNK
jgi:hypothetical protein